MALHDDASRAANERQAIQSRLDHLSDFVRVRPAPSPTATSAWLLAVSQSGPRESGPREAGAGSAGIAGNPTNTALPETAPPQPGEPVLGAPVLGAPRTGAPDGHEPATTRPSIPLTEHGPDAQPETARGDVDRPVGHQADTTPPPLPPWPRAGFWARGPAVAHGMPDAPASASHGLAISDQATRAVALRVADFGAAVEDLARALGGIEGTSPLLFESLRGVVRDGPDVDVRTWLHALLHLGRVAAPALRDALLSGDLRAARARADQLLRAAPTITGCARIATVLALGTADISTPGTPAEAAPLLFEALASRAVAHTLDRLREDVGMIERWLHSTPRSAQPIHLEGSSSRAWALVPRPMDAHTGIGHAGMDMVPWTRSGARGGVPAVTRVPPLPMTRAPALAGTPALTRAPRIPGLPPLDDAEPAPPVRTGTQPRAFVAPAPARRRRALAAGVPQRLLPEVVAARPDIRRMWLLTTAFSLLLLALALMVHIAGAGLAGSTGTNRANGPGGSLATSPTQTVAVLPTTNVGDTPAVAAATAAVASAPTAPPTAPTTSAAVVPVAATLSLQCGGAATPLGLHNPTSVPQSWTLVLPPGVRTTGLRGVVNPGKTLTIFLWPSAHSQATQATATLAAAGHTAPILLNVPSC